MSTNALGTCSGESNPGVQRPCADSLWATWKAAQAIAGLPFDVAHTQYARAVRAGFIQRSMLASRDFALALGALERLTLGPLARRV
jgi:hypothetical protein